jgi:hypothetical protein
MRTLALAVALAATAAAWPAAAQSVFRCVEAGGKVAYQSEACAQGATQRQVNVRDDAAPAPAVPRKSAWKGFTPPAEAAITFYYDPAEQPVGFSAEQMEADIRTAMEAWSSQCAVRLAYGGRRPSRPGTPAHVPIRWAPEYMRMAHPADARAGIAGTGSMEDGIALKPRFHEGHMLSVLIHEMGHVLGLPHNHDDPTSVMSYLRDEAARRGPRPSAADYHGCNASMKRLFGIEYQAPAAASQAPTGARMSDREALEKIYGKPGR